MSETEFAKAQLQSHLSSLLIPYVSEGFWSIYNSAQKYCEQEKLPAEVLKTFQNMLSKIPDWSEPTIATEAERVIKVSKCGYFDDLLMGVFLAYMKAFATLHYRGHSSHVKVEFDRPSFATFLHKLYSESARSFWKTAYLFKTQGVSGEQQAKNRQIIEQTISDSMEKVIRSILPWESIAKNYFVDTPSSTTKNVVFEDISDSDSEYSEEEDRKIEISDTDDVISVDETTYNEDTPRPKEPEILFDVKKEEEETKTVSITNDVPKTIEITKAEEEVKFKEPEPEQSVKIQEVNELDELEKNAEGELVIKL